MPPWSAISNFASEIFIKNCPKTSVIWCLAFGDFYFFTFFTLICWYKPRWWHSCRSCRIFLCSNPLLCYTAKILYWLILILTKWNTSCSAQILTNFQWWRYFKGIFIGRDSHHCRGEAALSRPRDSSCPFVNGHLSEISMTIKNVAQRR